MLVPVAVGKVVAQFDGTWLAGKNCNAASGAWLIWFNTNGHFHPSGGDVRARVKDPDGGFDTAGGTNPGQIADAMLHWGVDADVFYGMSFDTAWAWQHSGKFAIAVSISYAPISGTKWDGSPGFRGNHQIVVYKDDVYDPLADGRRPGIPKGTGRWGKTLVKKAAGLLNVAPVGQPYRALGAGKIYVMRVDAPKAAPAPTPAPVPEGPVTFRYGGEPRSRGAYRARPGIGAARIRSTPNASGKAAASIPAGTIVRTVLEGHTLPFRVAQTTLRGVAVAGNRKWHGDRTGRMWVHTSVVAPLE